MQSFTAKWSGTTKEFSLSLRQPLHDLHEHCAELFDLEPGRLKILGVVRSGKKVDESAPLESLGVQWKQPSHPIMVVGTTRASLQDARAAEQAALERQREAEARRAADVEAERVRAEEQRRRILQAKEERRQRLVALDEARLGPSMHASSSSSSSSSSFSHAGPAAHADYTVIVPGSTAGGNPAVVQLSLDCRARADDDQAELQARQALTPSRRRTASTTAEWGRSLSLRALVYGRAQNVCRLPPSALDFLVRAGAAFPLTFRVAPLPADDDGDGDGDSSGLPGGDVVVPMVDDGNGDDDDDDDVMIVEDDDEGAAQASASSSASSLSPLECAYVVVEAFEAGEGQCVLPRALCSQLGLGNVAGVDDDNDYSNDDDSRQARRPRRVRLETVVPARGTLVSLQPQQAAWTLIPEEERKALLEFVLRRYQCLFEQQRIRVPYGCRQFDLVVAACQPPGVISITDTDLQSELLPPLETSELGVLPVLPPTTNTTAAAKGAEAAAAVSTVIDGDVSLVVRGPLLRGQTRRFVFTVPERAVAPSDDAAGGSSPEALSALFGVRVSLRVRGGHSAAASANNGGVDDESPDVDLYVSHADDAAAGVAVGPDEYTWADETWRGHGRVGHEDDGASVKAVSIEPSHVAFRPGRFIVAVRAWTPLPGGSELALAVVARDRSGVEGTVSGTDPDSGSAAMTASAADGDGELCPHCGKRVPLSAQTMHAIRCPGLRGQRTAASSSSASASEPASTTCAVCLVVTGDRVELVSAAARAKHDALWHTPAPCPALCAGHGPDATIAGGRGERRQHRATQCPLRLVNCVYCPLRIALGDRGPHQELCGNRRCACRVCHSVLKRKEMRHHLHRQHDQPLDSISYRDFLPVEI